MTKQERKKLGAGSLSLFIFTISIIFSYLTINKKIAGEHILEYFNLYFHQSMIPIITVILLIISVVLGTKFKHHMFAKAGRVLSIILLTLFGIVLIVGFIKMLLGFF